MRIKLKKEPHEQQLAAINSADPEQLYGGAKRGGKSVWLCQKGVLLNWFFPGNRGLLCRYNFTDLLDTTLQEFWQVCPPELILHHHKGERSITLSTSSPESGKRSPATFDGYSPLASRQLYRGLGDPEDFEKTKGINLGHLSIDEPSEVPFDQYLMLRAQLTWQLPDGSRPPYMCMLASNPEPGWVEDRFIIDPQPGCRFFPSLPRDNPHLPPGYEDELRKSYPKEWVKKYLDGIWGASEGAIFKELSDEAHDLDNWTGDWDDRRWHEWAWQFNLIGGIDHGSTGITSYVLVGVDAFGNHFALEEYYRQERLIMDHAFDMHALRKRYCTLLTGMGGQTKEVDYTVIDPATTQRTLQGTNQLQSVCDAYREHGIPVIPGWNALELGLDRIKEHLHSIPTHRHPFTGIFGSPSLFISKKRCPNLWKEMRGLKKKVRPNGYIEIIGSDHAVDPIRYILNSRPRRPELLELDKKYLNGQERHFVESHDTWAKMWDKRTEGNTNEWFAGTGMVAPRVGSYLQ